MKRTTAALLTMLALMTAPLAAADYYEGKEECPPDHMCTTSTGSGSPEGVHDEPVECGADCDKSASGEDPDDGRFHKDPDCENCRGNDAPSSGDSTDGEPIPYGDEDCIACSGPGPVAYEGDCEETENGTVCQDVMYATGNGSDDDASALESSDDAAGGAGAADDRNVPSVGLLVLVGAVGMLAVMMRRRG